MKIMTEISALRQALSVSRTDTIALVPTMGCLHEGHLSLMRQARRLADVVVVSIYVNPLQFGAGEDFAQYPRTMEQDIERCQKAGVDIVFAPQNLYAADGAKVSLQVEGLDTVLCGASRPEHFDGVVTVVTMLFNIVQPDIAVFGEKDWQQLTILRRMVADLHMPVRIIAGALVREEDGLAMSSRNRYLQDDERTQALSLSQALHAMQQQAKHGADRDTLVHLGRKRLQQSGVVVDYLDIRDERNLQRLDDVSGAFARIFVAAKVGQTRLIDNMPLYAQVEIAE